MNSFICSVLSCWLQSQTQPDIDHRLLSEKYPRYPSVFDVSVNNDEKRMLMVSPSRLCLYCTRGVIQVTILCSGQLSVNIIKGR